MNDIEKLKDLIRTFKNIPFPCHDYMSEQQWIDICTICSEDPVKKNLFEKTIEQEINCDICGSVMREMYGGGWDNDRIVCTNRECGAEVEFPTSTEVEANPSCFNCRNNGNVEICRSCKDYSAHREE